MAPRTSVAIAQTRASTLPRLRTRFYPRGPGPGLWSYVLAFGVLPSVFATVILVASGVEGGFYMSESFIRGQHRAFLALGTVLTLAALTVLVYVLRGLWRGERQTVATACVLVLAIGWDWLLVSGLRSAMMPIISHRAVADYVAAPLPPRDWGVQAVQHDGRTFHVHVAVPQDMTSEDVPAHWLGPRLCRLWGALFAGPVDVVRVEFTRPDGTRFQVNAARWDCRTWYLQTRSPARRPGDLPPLDAPSPAPFPLPL
ncbi:MAG: hypothetical protein AAF914_07075 [Pseudomonadota bacterium]